MTVPPDRQGRLLFFGTAALQLGLVITALIAATSRNDLDIYLAASSDFFAGIDMYTKKYIDGFSYFYSPFFTLLVGPFLALGPVLSKLLWGALMFAALWRCWQLVKELLLRDVSDRERLIVAFFSALVLFQAVRDNLNSSQVTFFVLWFSLEGLHRIERGQWLVGALLIAIGIDMKLIPLVLLPYLIYRRQWKPALFTLIAVGALQLVPAVVVGWNEELGLLRSRWAMIDPNDARHIYDEEEPSTIALGSLISAYFSTEGGSPSTLSLPRNIVPLDLATVKVLLLLGRAAFALLALWFLRWPPFVAARNAKHRWWEVAYLLLCTVLVFPHQRNYSLMLGAPAVVWMVWHATAGPDARTTRTFAWWLPRVLLFLGFNATMIAGEFAPLFNHYKLFSFVTLGAILLLMRCKPEDLRAVDR